MPVVDHLVHGERSTYTVVVGEQESTWRGKGQGIVLTKPSLNVDWGLLLPFAVLKMIHNFIIYQFYKAWSDVYSQGNGRARCWRRRTCLGSTSGIHHLKRNTIRCQERLVNARRHCQQSPYLYCLKICPSFASLPSSSACSDPVHHSAGPSSSSS